MLNAVRFGSTARHQPPDRCAQVAVTLPALFDISPNTVDAEHRGSGLLHVVAHLLDVEEDQLVLPAPAEGNLQNARGDAKALSQRGQFGVIREVVGVLAPGVGGLRQVERGTDFTIWNVSVQ